MQDQLMNLFVILIQGKKKKNAMKKLSNHFSGKITNGDKAGHQILFKKQQTLH